MSKKIECRLPDQLYHDIKARCEAEKITVTDAVISNITDWLYNGKPACHDSELPGKHKEPVCHDKPALSVLQPEKNPDNMPKVYNSNMPDKRPVCDYACFNPQPKAEKKEKPNRYVPAATRGKTEEKPPCHSKAVPEIIAPASPGRAEKAKKEPETAKSPVIKTVEDVGKVLETAVKRPAFSRPGHHPTCKCHVCVPEKSKMSG